jgi:5-methyltetrahydrofolate--homocysteine methyltransferase
MATALRAAGWPAERPVELASVEAPHLVGAIHAAYVHAGAEVVTANTFGAHDLRLEVLALAHRVEELCAAAVRLAREAAGPDRYVAASIGPPGAPLVPLGERSFQAAVLAYRRQLLACQAAGADLFVCESFTDLLDVQAALAAAQEADVRPVAMSMALRPDRLVQGLVSPAACVEVAQALGAALVGVNCVPPDETVRLVEAMIPRARVPLLAQPAGCGLAGPAGAAAWAGRLAGLGVRGLGGCCGTTPADIAAIARALAPAGA